MCRGKLFFKDILLRNSERIPRGREEAEEYIADIEFVTQGNVEYISQETQKLFIKRALRVFRRVSISVTSHR